MSQCAQHCRKDLQGLSVKCTGSDGGKIKRTKHNIPWLRDDNNSLHFSRLCAPQRRKKVMKDGTFMQDIWRSD